MKYVRDRNLSININERIFFLIRRLLIIIYLFFIQFNQMCVFLRFFILMCFQVLHYLDSFYCYGFVVSLGVCGLSRLLFFYFIMSRAMSLSPEEFRKLNNVWPRKIWSQTLMLIGQFFWSTAIQHKEANIKTIKINQKVVLIFKLRVNN